MIRHWESLVEEQEGGYSLNGKGDVVQTAGRTIRDRDDVLRRAEEGHQRLTAKAVLFYANEGMVESIEPEWIQSSFDTLIRLFDRVGLWTKVHKTVEMVCRPCRAAGVQADKAYTRRMTREGKTFKEWQRERVICPEFWKDMSKGTLVMHRQTQYSVAKGGLGSEGDEADGGNETRTYRMAFPEKSGPRP